MLKKLTFTAAAGALLLALGAGAVHAERIVLERGLLAGNAPVAQQHYRGDARLGNRDHRRHRDGLHFAHPGHGPAPWRLYHPGHPDVHWYHWDHAFRHHHGQPRHYHRVPHGFYFPGYGLIHHGHRHSRSCPDWHFEAFAWGVAAGAALDD